jgi:hypothetical protein
MFTEDKVRDTLSAKLANNPRLIFSKIKASIVSKDTWDKFVGSAEMYEMIPFDKVLLFQLDVTFCKGKNSPSYSKFLEWDYIGAPWAHLPNGLSVGNGGLSIRSVPKMIQIANSFARMPEEADDLFFAGHIRQVGGLVPSPEVAAEFSIESVFHPNPFGTHIISANELNRWAIGLWKPSTTDQATQLLENCPNINCWPALTKRPHGKNYCRSIRR